MRVPEEVLATIENARAAGQVDSFEYKNAVLDRFLWKAWGSFECETIYYKRIRLRDDDEAGISALYEEFKDIIEDIDVSLADKIDAAKERSKTMVNEVGGNGEKELL